MNTKSLTNRKRGGQPGNTNALKHGFYSEQLKGMRRDGPLDPDEVDRLGLSDEIAMLRLFTRRIIHMGRDVQDLTTYISLLRVLCFSMTTLTRLLRTQQLLAPDNEFADAVNQALEEVYEELFTPGNPPPG